MTLLKILFLILVLILVGMFLRTLQLAASSQEKEFSAGTATTMPDGFYLGTVIGPKVTWLGKRFDAARGTGINVFSTATNTTTDKYPFVFSQAQAVHNTMQVIAIDYNLPENPWYLRPVLDEIVMTAPGQYLGKLQLRIIPGYPFALTFFGLKAQ